MIGRWYKKYTPQECARLCSKISNFYGSSCTHFSRQWITSRVPEHRAIGRSAGQPSCNDRDIAEPTSGIKVGRMTQQQLNVLASQYCFYV